MGVAYREAGRTINPLDVLEELVSANDWAFDRHSECELVFDVGGRWCGYHVYVVWDRQLHAVFFSCQLDLRVPETRRGAVFEMLARINEKLWLGHFDYISEEATTMYRHAVPLRGGPGLSAEQLEDLVDVALDECERFYPALQLVVWGGRGIGDALAVARMDTVGEA